MSAPSRNPWKRTNPTDVSPPSSKRRKKFSSFGAAVSKSSTTSTARPSTRTGSATELTGVHCQSETPASSTVAAASSTAAPSSIAASTVSASASEATLTAVAQYTPRLAGDSSYWERRSSTSGTAMSSRRWA
jgi:hypothetical protein